MDRVLRHYFEHIVEHAQFKAIRTRAPFHPLGRALFFGNHGLHRLANYIPTTPPNHLTAEQILHLWLTAEYVRLSDSSCTSHAVDLYGFINLWPTILHERKPALTTAVIITNYVKASIVQYYPQFTYDDTILTTIADAIVTVFDKPYIHLALSEQRNPRQSVTPTPRRTHSYWKPPSTKSMVRHIDPEDGTEYCEPQDDTDDYWGMTAEENALIEQEYQDAMDREGIAQDRMEFDELERQTRYNDTDSWQNPHGYRD